MDIKVLPQIQTRFWCQSILDAFELKSLYELKKLSELYYDDFINKYNHLFSNTEISDKAFNIFCTQPFDPKTWSGYFKGTSPTKKNKEKQSSFDIIGSLIPQTQNAYNGGCFNILNVFCSSYIKDAITAFSEGVTELYKINGEDIKVFQGSLEVGGKPELVLDFREIFESNLERGNFSFCFNYYADILNQGRVELGESLSILQLMESYIRVNFFGESYSTFSRILVEGTSIHYLRDNYKIPPYLWKKTFPVICDALSHYSKNKDEMFWIEEKESFVEE